MVQSGDQLLKMCAALASPHRLRIIAVLHAQGRIYVSQLARELNLSRPLTHLHLRKLEEAGLVQGRLEIASDGKVLNYYEASEFSIVLSPEAIARAMPTLTDPTE